MREKANPFVEKIANLLSVKSIVTLALTAGQIALLFGAHEPPKEALALFCTSYGAVITYFFTKKEGGSA
jgi:hypothetical protein